MRGLGNRARLRFAVAATVVALMAMPLGPPQPFDPGMRLSDRAVVRPSLACDAVIAALPDAARSSDGTLSPGTWLSDDFRVSDASRYSAVLTRYVDGLAVENIDFIRSRHKGAGWYYDRSEACADLGRRMHLEP